MFSAQNRYRDPLDEPVYTIPDRLYRRALDLHFWMGIALGVIFGGLAGLAGLAVAYLKLRT